MVNPGGEKKGIDLGVILQVFELIMKFGVPAVSATIDKIKASGADPTLDEVRGLLEGLEPPERVPGSGS